MNRVQIDFNPCLRPAPHSGRLLQRERWRWRGPGVPRVAWIQMNVNKADRGGSG